MKDDVWFDYDPALFNVHRMFNLEFIDDQYYTRIKREYNTAAWESGNYNLWFL